MISGVSRVYTHMHLEKSVSISVRDTAKVQGREVRRMDLKGLVGQGFEVQVRLPRYLNRNPDQNEKAG